MAIYNGMPAPGLEAVLTGVLAIDAPSHSTTIDNDEDYRIVKFTGALVADKNFVFPADAIVRRVFNLTTGAYNLGVRKASGAIAIIPQGEVLEII